jgi:GNAT superfamily N-acetyltransferase
VQPKEIEPARIRLRVTADLAVSPDAEFEPIDYEADVILLDEDFEDVEGEPIGHVSYRVVSAFFEVGKDNGNSVVTLDAIDAGLGSIAETIDENIEEIAGDGVWGLLVIDSIWVDPKHRGQGIASHVIWRLLKLYEGAALPDHAVAILDPWDKDSLDEEATEFAPEEADERRERLFALFERSGFRRIGDTDIVIFALENEIQAPNGYVYTT